MDPENILQIKYNGFEWDDMSLYGLLLKIKLVLDYRFSDKAGLKNKTKII